MKPGLFFAQRTARVMVSLRVDLVGVAEGILPCGAAVCSIGALVPMLFRRMRYFVLAFRWPIGLISMP